MLTLGIKQLLLGISIAITEAAYPLIKRLYDLFMYLATFKFFSNIPQCISWFYKINYHTIIFLLLIFPLFYPLFKCKKCCPYHAGIITCLSLFNFNRSSYNFFICISLYFFGIDKLRH